MRLQVDWSGGSVFLLPALRGRVSKGNALSHAHALPCLALSWAAGCEFLGNRRDAGTAANHAFILHQKSASGKIN